LADPIQKDPEDWHVVPVRSIEGDVVPLQFAPPFAERLRLWNWLPESGGKAGEHYLERSYQYLEHQIRWRDGLKREDAKQFLLKALEKAFDHAESDNPTSTKLGALARFEDLKAQLFHMLCAEEGISPLDWLLKTMRKWGVPLDSAHKLTAAENVNDGKATLVFLRNRARRWLGVPSRYLDWDDITQIVIERLLTGRYETLPERAETAKTWLKIKLRDEVKRERKAAASDVVKAVADPRSESLPDQSPSPVESLENEVTVPQRLQIEAAVQEYLQSLPKELTDVLDACEKLRLIVSNSGVVTQRYGAPVDGELRKNYWREVAEYLGVPEQELRERLARLAKRFKQFLDRFK
jgi:DNA-directed RNA polymerase specialized sigma24 family protein